MKRLQTPQDVLRTNEARRTYSNSDFDIMTDGEFYAITLCDDVVSNNMTAEDVTEFFDTLEEEA